MKFYLTLHIKSCQASWCSNDIMVSQLIKAENITINPNRAILDEEIPLWDPEQNIIQNLTQQCTAHTPTNNVATVTINNQKYNISNIGINQNSVELTSEIEAPKYSRRDRTKSEMLQLEQNANSFGFTKETNQEIHQQNLQTCHEKTLIQNEVNKLTYHTLPYAFPKPKLEDYQGGFSNILWQYMLEDGYVKSETVYGYLGAHERTIMFDALIETYFREYVRWNEQYISRWTTSTNGRHTADNIPDNPWNYPEYIVNQSYWNPASETDKTAPKYIKCTNKSTQILTRKLREILPDIDHKKVRAAQGYINEIATDNLLGYFPENYSPGKTGYWTSPHRNIHNDRILHTIFTIHGISPEQASDWLSNHPQAYQISAIMDKKYPEKWFLFPFELTKIPQIVAK